MASTTLTAIFSAQDKLSGALDKAGDSGSRLSGIISGIGQVGAASIQGLTIAIGAATTALGGLLSSAINVGKDFETSMSQVAATMGLDKTVAQDAADFALLEQAAKDMGAETAFSAAEAADALNNLASAGYDAQKAAQALPAVLHLAGGGGMELAAASSMLTDSMSSLGIEATYSNLTRFSDELTVAAQASNASVSQMGEAILTIGGTAKSLKNGTVELNTLLGILADNGLKGAEGGTMLRNVMQSLTAPIDQASEALDSLGVSVYDDKGKMRGMNEIFQDLNQSMSGWTDEQRSVMLSEIFNKVDLKAVEALLANTGDRYDELFAEIENSSGACAKMYATMMDNLAGDLDEFSSAAESLGIEIYQAISEPLRGIVRDGANYINQLSSAFTRGGFSGLLSEFGNVFGEIVTRIANGAPMALRAGTTMVKALFSSIVKNSYSIAQAGAEVALSFVEGISTLFPALASTGSMLLLRLIQGITTRVPDMMQSATIGIVAFVNNISSMLPSLASAGVDMLIALVTGFISNAPALASAAGTFITALVSAIASALPQIIEALPTIIASMWEAVKSSFANLGPLLGDTFTSLFTGLYDSLEGLGALRPIIMGVVGAMLVWKAVTLAQAAWTAILAAKQALLNGITGAWKVIMLGVNAVMSANPIAIIVLAIGALIAGFIALYNNCEWFRNWFDSVWAGVADFFINAWNGVLSFVDWLVSGIVGFFQWLYDVLVGHSIIPDLCDAIVGWFQNLVGWVVSIFQNIVNAVSAIWNSLVGFFTGIWNAITAIFRGDWSGVWDGLVQAASAIWDAVVAIFDFGINMIKGLFDFLGLGGVWDWLVSSAQAAWDWICGIWNGFIDWWNGLWSGGESGSGSGFWDGLCGLAQGAWGIITGLWSGITGFFGGIWDGISGAAAGIWDGITSVASSAWDGICNAWNGAGEWFGNVWDGIKNGMGNIWNNVKDTASRAWDGICNVWRGAGNWFGNVWDGLKTGAGNLWNGIVNVAGNAWNGITDWWNSLWGGGKTEGETAVDDTQALLDKLDEYKNGITIAIEVQNFDLPTFSNRSIDVGINVASVDMPTFDNQTVNVALALDTTAFDALQTDISLAMSTIVTDVTAKLNNVWVSTNSTINNIKSLVSIGIGTITAAMGMGLDSLIALIQAKLAAAKVYFAAGMIGLYLSAMNSMAYIVQAISLSMSTIVSAVSSGVASAKIYFAAGMIAAYLAVANAMTNIVQAVVSGIVSISSSKAQFGAVMIAMYLAATYTMANIALAVSAGMHSMTNAIITGAANAKVQLGAAMISMYLAVYNTMVNIASAVTNGITNATNNLATGLISFHLVASKVLSDTVTLFSDKMTAIATNVTNTITQITNDFNTLLELLSTPINIPSSGSDWGGGGGETRGGGAGRDITSNAPDTTITATVSVDTSALDALGSYTITLPAVNTSLMTTSFTSGMNSIWSTANTTMSNIRSTVASGISAARIAFAAGVIGMYSSVTSGMSSIKATVSSGMNSIRATIISVNLASAGQNMMNGLRNGILRGMSGVITAAKSVAQAAADAVELTLQIGSPSKLMDEFGTYFGAGFAQGISNSTGNVIDAAQRMADSASAPFDVAPPDFYSNYETERHVTIELKGSGSIRTNGANAEELWDLFKERIRETFCEMVQEDIVTGGDDVYDY